LYPLSCSFESPKKDKTRTVVSGHENPEFSSHKHNFYLDNTLFKYLILPMSNNNFDIQHVLDDLLKSYKEDSGTNFIDDLNLPVLRSVQEILDNLLEILFPGYKGLKTITSENAPFIIGSLLCEVKKHLNLQITRALKHECKVKNSTDECHCEENAEKITGEMLDSLVTIRKIIKSDVAAAYAGDPAARSFEEIVISYPGVKAIAIHRIAHELYRKDVPLIPRMMNEIAHSETGIDIHPGATIGESFFIDHGTGVVIGETSIIGENVKIYQGVTLGALSFSTDENGNVVKGIKRHPEIGDDVTIYAEATILGNIKVGKGSVIGGNVWIKEDVPEGTLVGHPKIRNVEKKL